MTNEELAELMKDGFQGINVRLDALNGRTRLNSEAIVEIRAVAAERDKQGSKDMNARITAAAAGIVAGLGALWQYIQNK